MSTGCIAEKIFDGGCVEYKDLVIREESATSISECKTKCLAESLCKEFIFPKDGSNRCFIFKPGCTSSGGSTYAKYSIEKCVKTGEYNRMVQKILTRRCL